MTKTSSSNRPSKFTPQAIEKIKECVKQGLGGKEIARLLDVPLGSLQGTCHRLGISLRRTSVHDQSYDRSQSQTVEQDSRPLATLAIRIKRKDHECALDVPVSQEELASLRIEASLRGMGLVELIVQLLCEAAKKDMIETILDGEERAA